MSQYKKPATWGMPKELEERMSEVMNQHKPKTTPLGDLMDILGRAAIEIANVEPEPAAWAGWITYLLAILQAEAEKDSQNESYDSMLLTLRDSLDQRIEQKKW
jgi:hypothetical protein